MSTSGQHSPTSVRPSRVHLLMVFLAMIVAVLLYLDRICLSTAAGNIQRDLNIDNLQWDRVLSAFFLTYALAQVPAGWLGDRFGARWILAIYVLLWSASTGLMGLATGWISLVVLRLACGLFEAGAYPVASSILRRWVPVSHRGLASSMVAVGGRAGGAIAPILTAQLMLWWTFGANEWPTGPDRIASDTSWRPVMMFYGLLGIVVAAVFVYFFRDWPSQHPRVNEEERKWIESTPHVANINREAQTVSASKVESTFWIDLISHKGLWLNSFVQFASNFGWAFLVTLMPKFLKDVHGASLQSQGYLQSLPLFAGIFGLLVGGKLTDMAMRRWGSRWGRAFTLVLSRTIVGLSFVACLFVRDPLSAALCMAFVGFSTDIGNPACWAYSQDVGGRYSGTVLGWMNMWGNLGAFASPLVLGFLSRLYLDSPATGWQAAFLFCAFVQVIAAICAFFVDSTKKLDA